MLKQMLENYRLTTAEILYHFPDHPSLLQTYVWQELDLTPDFPELMQFLNFWDRSLDGKIHSVTVAECSIIKPSEYRYFDNQTLIH